MTIKVQLGFTNAGSNPPFFTLDDATKGKLNSTEYVLGGGEGLVDVTDYVRTAQVQRGKSRELDRYDAGQATVTFNNATRAFDPTFLASPFYGQIVPRRRLRITMDDIVQFDGLIDDWNIELNQGGFSVATCQAFDGFSLISSQELLSFIPTAQLSGARVTAVLDNINWPTANRSIDTGNSQLAADLVQDGTNALDYLNLIATSEPGDIFINKNGDVEYQGRLSSTGGTALLLSDQGDGIPYQNVRVVYGSEFLYNLITATSPTSQATKSDAYSIALYGERDLTIDTILANDSDLDQLSSYQLANYKNPELRFEGLTVNLNAVTGAQRQALLQLELSDRVQVKLTPSNIPPAISQFGSVLSLNYNFEPGNEQVEIGLSTVGAAFFILDDAQLGKLDEGILAW